MKRKGAPQRRHKRWVSGARKLWGKYKLFRERAAMKGNIKRVSARIDRAARRMDYARLAEKRRMFNELRAELLGLLRMFEVSPLSAEIEVSELLRRATLNFAAVFNLEPYTAEGVIKGTIKPPVELREPKIIKFPGGK